MTKISKLGEAFISYGNYHYNSINKIIHIICVPIIAGTLLCLLSYIPYHINLFGVSIGVAEIVYICGMVYYFYLNLVFGFATTLLTIGLSIGWRMAFKGSNNETIFKVILGLQIVSWLLQFIGHGIFQKRKPALMDNITQIFVAPMFVIIQLIDMVGLGSQELKIWKKIIEKNVKEFREKDKSN